ncbi:MAG: hypothetical protein ACJ763_16145 [Bdellovibrionia bacterium]
MAMPLELWFLIAGLVLTVVLGIVLVPIIRKAIKEDEQRNSNP